MRPTRPYHMRDQVRHRVRDIMRTDPSGAETPALWPLAAVLLVAAALVNVLMISPAS